MASNSRWYSLAKQILTPLLKSIFKSSGSSGSGSSGPSRGGSTSQGQRPGSGASQGGQRGQRTTTPRDTRPGSGPTSGGSARRGQASSGGASGAQVTPQEAAARGAAYPGDYTGPLNPVYSPEADGEPDPGEIVWAWVPYEEDHSQGKDRPVLLVGRDGQHLLALMLTSKDHTREHDRNYLDIGSGDWDRQGRPSEVKLDRVVRVDAQTVRREGAVLDAGRFASVADALHAR